MILFLILVWLTGWTEGSYCAPVQDAECQCEGGFRTVSCESQFFSRVPELQPGVKDSVERLLLWGNRISSVTEDDIAGMTSLLLLDVGGQEDDHCVEVSASIIKRLAVYGACGNRVSFCLCFILYQVFGG